jgi:hypothetical protein
MFPKTITVDVTEEDIKRGVRKSCSKCPIARAITRQFTGLYIVRVDRGDVTLFDAPYRVCFWAELPSYVMDCINRFDEDGLMEPFSFSLNDLEYQ